MTATNIKNSILTMLASVGLFIANQLGGWDIALGVLIAFIALDYITGIVVAGVFKKSPKTANGGLSSAAGLKGLIRKGTMLLIVWVACLLDKLIGATYIRTTVILFFIGNEGLSIVENVGDMGVQLPKFLKNALEAMKEKNDDPTGAGK